MTSDEKMGESDIAMWIATDELPMPPWKGKVKMTIDLTYTGRDTGPQYHYQVTRLMERAYMDFRDEKTQKMRRTMMTATDASAILHGTEMRGENKYCSINKLLRRKMGLEEAKMTPAMQHGIFYERRALRVYEQVTGNKTIGPLNRFFIGPPPGHNYKIFWDIGCTPDAVCAYIPVLVEIKCPYGIDEIKGGIPDLYWPQVQVQMAVTGIHTVHFVRFIPPSLLTEGEINIVEVRFDYDWWVEALEYFEQFSSRLARIRYGYEQPPEARKRREKKSSLSITKRQIGRAHV